MTRWQLALVAWSALVAWWAMTGGYLAYLLVVWVVGVGVIAMVRTIVRR